MTPPPQPQQEYIITEELLTDIELRLGAFYGSKIIRSRPHTPSPQWTDEEVMKELQDAFDRGVEAAESTIDIQKHDTHIRTTERNATLDEPRDCATCNNKQNAVKYVKRMNACSMRVHMKKQMDDLKECCPECRCNGEFKFDEKKCRGYNGNCNQSSCNDFCWWHARCNCKIIREYDEQKKSLRAPIPPKEQQR